MEIQCVSGNGGLLAALSECADTSLRVVRPGLIARRYLVSQPEDTSAVLIVDANAFSPDSLFVDVLDAYRKQYPRVPVAVVADKNLHHRVLDAIKAHLCDQLIDSTADPFTLHRHVASLALHAQRLASLRPFLMRTPEKHLFVTGATGFLGEEFVQEVLRSSNHRITALSRANEDMAYDQRIRFKSEDYPNRLHFVEGDVRRPGLGLSPDAFLRLEDSIDEIWHFAAITSFDEVLRPKIFKVNLEGTENVIDFAQQLKGLACFNHISTAYVAGKQAYPAVIPEAIATEAPEFTNPYEESKFLAERRVANSGLPYLVYRPSIVLGETVSGRNDGQTVYNVAKMVRLAKLLGERDATKKDLARDYHTFRVVADPAAFKNMIPIDDVISMCLRIRAANPAMGSVFHTTHPQAARIADLIEVIAGLLHTEHYEIVPSLEGESLSVPEKVLERVAEVFTPYMVNSDPVFEMENVRRTLGNCAVPEVGQEYLRLCLDTFYSLYFGVDYNVAAVGA